MRVALAHGAHDERRRETELAGQLCQGLGRHVPDDGAVGEDAELELAGLVAPQGRCLHERGRVPLARPREARDTAFHPAEDPRVANLLAAGCHATWGSMSP